ncbi:E3 ubiquitin/ISG15 ligase TRIM25-like [Centroberyx affinis]|uniref:E3 ubiquitin/ISG15 ligase TRIM25-like n=1 Tax=Centroberyx affinis TaxID=166261 RepID=UPI003A5C0EC7
MAQQETELDGVKFCCSICLDLLKDPVTIPCGHSYCMSCIKSCWDKEDKKKIHSCPQCRQTFTPRPVLVKSTVLAELLEELKKTAAPPDRCHPGPGDVACDVCTGRKRKAHQSCLVCLTSYCEHHIQHHYNVASLKKHKLVKPSRKLHENICSRHDEVMKIFCRTDQKCICYLCSMDEHKGHDTVSAAAERTERQKELGVSRQKIQQRIQDREKDVKVLQQEVEAINLSADKPVDREKIFTELVHFIEKRSLDAKEQMRSQQKGIVSRAEELQEKLRQEIAELKRKDAELEQLSHTEDHIHFLQRYTSISCLSESTDSPSTNIRPLRYFEDVTVAVSEARDKLQDILTEEWPETSLTVTQVDVLLPQPEPKTTGEFLQYSHEIMLDHNTADTCLSLSDASVIVESPYLESKSSPKSSELESESESESESPNLESELSPKLSVLETESESESESPNLESESSPMSSAFQSESESESPKLESESSSKSSAFQSESESESPKLESESSPKSSAFQSESESESPNLEYESESPNAESELSPKSSVVESDSESPNLESELSSKSSVFESESESPNLESELSSKSSVFESESE